MAKDLAIVMNSGSLNSLVTTCLAAQKYRPIMIYMDFGAVPPPRYRIAYDLQVSHFKPYREHSLSLSHLASMRLADGGTAASADPRQQGLLAPQLTDLLPILFNALPIAAHYQAAAIYFGLRIGPGHDDLAQAMEYTQICNELIQIACQLRDMEIVAPLIDLEPWQVVDVGTQVNAPLEKGWSCLENTPEPCGICRGCRNREQAFQSAGKPDPLQQAKKRL
jgi:7-cyano-7-deazaguanine synthase in queuosine biosynthesis